eukprot:scaffold47341_cov53-Attheya_sp.AAC.1
MHGLGEACSLHVAQFHYDAHALHMLVLGYDKLLGAEIVPLCSLTLIEQELQTYLELITNDSAELPEGCSKDDVCVARRQLFGIRQAITRLYADRQAIDRLYATKLPVNPLPLPHNTKSTMSHFEFSIHPFNHKLNATLNNILHFEPKRPAWIEETIIIHTRNALVIVLVAIH